jgi:hypothetical protein
MENAMSSVPTIGPMLRRLRIFVASPGDVKIEREKATEVIERVNKNAALAKGVLLDPWLWEVDAQPAIGRPQESINTKLDEAAIVILILWNRLGTPSGKADSGTVEEYEGAFKRFRQTGWPRILAYYSQRKGKPLNADENAQRQKVLDFQKQHPEIFAAEYCTTAEFAEKLESHLINAVNEIAAPSAAPVGRYKKLLYVKVTYLREKTAGATPVYHREVERLAEETRTVDVYDEAVYYTLEIFPSKKKIERRTDQSSGVVDPRMIIPLRYPLVFGDKFAARAANTAQMDVDGETDTLLTISHFENGLQGNEQNFASRVEEDAEYARMIVDFSSIPDARTRVLPGSAWLRREGKDEKTELMTLGDSMYMVSCEEAKAGDYLGMSFTIQR